MKSDPEKPRKGPQSQPKLTQPRPGLSGSCLEAAEGPPAGWPAGRPSCMVGRLSCKAGRLSCHGPLVPPQAFPYQPGSNPSSRTASVRVSCSPNFRFSKTLHPTSVVSGNPLPSLAYINPPYSPFKSTPNLLEKFSKESYSLFRTWVQAFKPEFF